ncbi:MAG TPA: hypothetical protein PLP69_08175 [Bacteroidales bacterium]|nr:hypothetical protein [Bacteroidales bacterium]
MKGIDVQIESLRSTFESLLWTAFNNSFNGRCMHNYREGVIPEVLNDDSHEYKEVLLDDKFDSIVFFDVLPKRGIGSADVNIYFAVNLSTIYPSVDERATEHALSDVAMVIKRHANFEMTSITDGFESWKDWSMVKQEDNMQPFYLFRIETTVTYNLIC